MNFLQELFTIVLNLSVTATYVAISVILVRIFLRKAPKIFSYVLWLVVLVRLICPFSFTSDFSILGLLDKNTLNRTVVLEKIPQEFEFMQIPTQQPEIELMDSELNANLPQTMPITSLKPMDSWIRVFSIVWIIGVFLLFFYSIIAYIKTKRHLNTATLIKGNIYGSDRISTAFVFGAIYPKIYVPLNINDTDTSYILEHEQIHIIRRDHMVKPLAFLTLIIHWFNPLMWLSFVLMSKDMEMSCDESVIRKMGEGARGGYSGSLLSQSMKRSGLLTVSPLAFGESHVKSRIKNILKFKKPAFWIMAVAVIFVIIVSISLLTNPSKAKDDIDTSEQTNDAQQITPNPSEWLPEQNLGADMAVLDYASDEIVIFHGYFGLFVYDLDKLQITQSLNLEPLECNMTQGDDYCEVSVSMDGGTINLHPMSSEDMYIYTVSSNTLEKSTFQQMENAFRSSLVPIEEAVDSEIGSYSYNAVRFDTEEYGFLHTSDWTLGTLTYIRGDMIYNLFQVNDDPSIEDASIKTGSDIVVENPTILLNTPVDEKVCLGIFRTEQITEQYYIPDDEVQKELIQMMDTLEVKTISEGIFTDRYYLGINIVYQGLEWQILSDGSLYHFAFNESEDTKHIAENNNLSEIVLQIAERELGIIPFHPSTIKGVTSAELTVAFSSKKEKVYKQTITDSIALTTIDKLFSEAEIIYGGSGCPFSEGALTLVLENGQRIKIALATDSCCMYFVNGIYFDYKPAKARGQEDSGVYNNIIFDYFNEIPVSTRGREL